MTALPATRRGSADEALPASWHLLPEGLRKPFWTVQETTQATGLSRSTLHREWSDPRSPFPRKRHVGARVHVPALDVLRYMETAGPGR